jgi:hypothetical protein
MFYTLCALKDRHIHLYLPHVQFRSEYYIILQHLTNCD